MKRIFFLLLGLSLLGAVEAKSQVVYSQTATNSTGAITNTGIDTMTYTMTKGYGRALHSMTYTRATGTGAGTAILEYKLVSADNYKSDAGDTLTVANSASQTLYWNKTVTAKYWRIRVGGGTTVTATVTAHIQTD